ncbi:MAG TPA: ATP-dependent DNA ligase [Candidatus Angelobacter sp.]|nr:ATP-dependent DNA ligase [Candidatus Angelobacter sp.]
MAASTKARSTRVRTAALPAEALDQPFPKLALRLQPPYPPAEAKSVKELPHETGWLYEPKWDGFRCLAFRSGNEIVLQSKAGQPLTRYFPEIVEALRAIKAGKFVLDGEIVVASHGDAGVALDFDALLQRIHPAASRVQRLSRETPATYMLFDLLVNEKGESLVDQPLSARRMKLQEFAGQFLQEQSNASRKTVSSERSQNSLDSRTHIQLSPATADFSAAEKWMREGAASGWDGVVAKRLDCEYTSGERTGMVKIKRIRTADCVVGGFRWARGKEGKAHAKKPGEQVGSLLLGLYNAHGELDHIGFSSSFSREERKKLKSILKPLIAGPARNSGEHEIGDQGGFTGKAPGGPSRWTRDDRDTEWVPLKPKLVGGFQYDHFSGGRFRHGTKFLRWRPEKKPQQCTMEQVRPSTRKASTKIIVDRSRPRLRTKISRKEV